MSLLLPARHRRLYGLVAALALLITLSASSSGFAAGDVLLSRGRPALSSSDESSSLNAAKAVDGNTATRWASEEGLDPQWIRVDLGAAHTLTRVHLDWEAAYGKAYRVEVSPDGSAWTKAYSTTTGDGGIDEVALPAATAGRYVRVYGTARGTAYGYSLKEFEVYGPAGGPDTTAPTAPGNPRVTGTTATSVSLAWDASTDDVGVTGYQVTRDGAVVATATGTTYTDTGRTQGTAYTYTVNAVDAAGNVSAASAPVTGTPGQSSTSFTVVAAGDIADPGCAAGNNCGAENTAKRVEAINPDEVLTLGDNQYDTGSLSDFKKYYGTTWGRFLNKTHPSTGNHEYDDSTPAAGYKGYFGSRATPDGKTYYSWDRGGWHFVALDTETSMSATSAQGKWLEADLTKNTNGCVAAYWHRPLYSSGPQADMVSKPVWQILRAHGADLILNGHDHLYERFAPQNATGGADPAGVRELIVGTGGADSYGFESAQPNSQKRITDVKAVLKLTLTPTTYTGQLIRDNGSVLDTFGPVTCH
ncbi:MULTISPECIES: discoidin domain-containing protein [Streptomyces]|uniref:discoidin domain-containing protein n=1 Tax=Streptomyces TaxID=1883 RepID=UPI001FD48C5E|nr:MULTISPECIES: discoidin domain-containing protein [Streptomyces]MCZ4094986.1 discoidin domain-containing protein [Streptomyces sp. H39-C1]